jgi:hypothetical protein
MPYRQAQWTTSITIGTKLIGNFKSWEGGSVDSEDSKYQNHDGEIVLGGRRTRENGTARRLFKEEDAALVKFLDESVGTSAEIVRAPVGDDGVAWGQSYTLKGKLKSVALPDHDAASEDGGELVLEFSLNSALTVAG